MNHRLVPAFIGTFVSLFSAQALSDAPNANHELQKDRASFYTRAVDDRREYEVLSYELRGTFDWSLQRLNADLDIKIVSKAGQKSVVLDSHIPTIQRVGVKNGPELSYHSNLETGLLEIDTSSLASDFTLNLRYLVDIKSARGQGIYAVPPRKGDPIRIPVVFTLSEPLGASYWMPCNDTPTNRARFSTEFKMPVHESLISNGDLLVDKVHDGVRTMKYATQYTLPTYLMAFAQGEFVRYTQSFHGLPVSIWARKGVAVEWDGMLKRITTALAHFERLLIPYPYEKYTLVLLPGFGGGLENVGITFQGEESSQQSNDHNTLELSAHELAHQWFGDYVTVKSWDDLWIKEGMATLLAAESTRPYEDKHKTGTLFGHFFNVKASDAVIDPQLPPDDKYTSGPYGRSAWVLTQIRGLVGEVAFWGTLKRVLETHAFSAISTDEFLAFWESSLGTGQVSHLKKILYRKGLPELVPTLKADGKALSLELKDPEELLLAPISIRRYKATGNFEQTELSVKPSQLYTALENEFLVLDPQGRHPLELFFPTKEARKELAGYIVPKTQQDTAAFLHLGSHFQQWAFSAGQGWKWTPAQARAYFEESSSELSRFQALLLACELGQGSKGAEREEWKRVIERNILNAPYLGMEKSDRSMFHCLSLLPENWLHSNLASIEFNAVQLPHSETEWTFLSLFPVEAELSYRTWERMGKEGASTSLRALAVEQLLKHITGKDSFPPTLESKLSQWKFYFRSLLRQTEVDSVVKNVLKGIVVLKDSDSWEPLAHFVRETARETYKKPAVCTAYHVTVGKPTEWLQFVGELGDLSQYSFELRETIGQPGVKCKTE